MLKTITCAPALQTLAFVPSLPRLFVYGFMVRLRVFVALEIALLQEMPHATRHCPRHGMHEEPTDFLFGSGSSQPDFE